MNISHAILVTGSRTWDDPSAMQRTFNTAWLTWGPSTVTHPLLISGSASNGADAMAEHLFRQHGFPVEPHPADWRGAGRGAGMTRNVAMVRRAHELQQAGVPVIVTAFLDLCDKRDCPRIQEQQLFPASPGHFSHGTVHCRSEAIRQGLPVLDAYSERTLPF